MNSMTAGFSWKAGREPRCAGFCSAFFAATCTGFGACAHATFGAKEMAKARTAAGGLLTGRAFRKRRETGDRGSLCLPDEDEGVEDRA
jgi:hypothetical protein